MLIVPGISSCVISDMASGLAMLTTRRLPVLPMIVLPPGVSPAE